ncbi:MAG: HAD-IIB family hydrolase [Methylococcales bacterium]|nr:HAD-IIB family hydrolase [Methylococcales bacterium]
MSENRYYIAMISIHGLIRGQNLELGRDADTGGQTQYVVDLTRALAQQDTVARVELITRRVIDDRVSEDYAQPAEDLPENGARIVRIEAGPDAYLPKEELWPYLDSFADNLLTYLQQQKRMPDLLHSHYADAGYVGVRLSHMTGIPLVHTGHSLGRDKHRRLLASGQDAQVIEQRYHLARRIEAEEEVLANADHIITSTRHEINEQYELYDCYPPERMIIIPPGTDLSRFYPARENALDIAYHQALLPFWREPDKPVILALSRPDERKNIISLLRAYGESKALQDWANLLIIAGNRDDITELDDGAQQVLTELLLTLDAYDLHGKVALPKHHHPDDVADIYRLTAASGGVFINPALTEPFGLTLLEAAACGCPIVATENGGPVDIIGNLHNGLLVDPLDTEAIASALLVILRDSASRQRYVQNGLDNIEQFYAWKAHAQRYLEQMAPLLKREQGTIKISRKRGKHLYQSQALFSDIDHSLLGDAQALTQFTEYLRSHRKSVLWGIATGRSLESAMSVLKKHKVPLPDVLITRLGTEIYSAPDLTLDQSWIEHIDYHWSPKVIRKLLADVPGLTLQESRNLSRFKLSYYYDREQAPPVEDINTLLRQHDLAVTMALSFQQYLDITPARASKGQALRYFAQKWRIPLESILVAGGSGADEDMMQGNTLAVVVANRYREELSELTEVERIYFAKEPHALGILEAIEHYHFLTEDD